MGVEAESLMEALLVALHAGLSAVAAAAALSASLAAALILAKRNAVGWTARAAKLARLAFRFTVLLAAASLAGAMAGSALGWERFTARALALFLADALAAGCAAPSFQKKEKPAAVG